MYEDFCSEEYKKNNNYVRAIAYTNPAVDAMNLNIRYRIFNTRNLDQFMVGENLIVGTPVMEKINKHNVWDIVYTVGERLRVLDTDIKIDPEYGFNVWHLTVIDYESPKPEEKKIKVIHQDSLNLYYNTKDSIVMECRERLEQKTIDRYGKERNCYTKTEAWKPYYDFKNEYSWVKYSYAMTTHKCVSPNTIISTSNGSYRMKSINMGDSVIDGHGIERSVNLKSVTEHINQVNIKLKSGQILECGTDHPVLSFDGNAYKYIKASKLNIGDYVCIAMGNPKLSDEFVHIPLNDFINNGVDDKSKWFSELTPDLAWTLGALIGDGCYTYTSNRIDYTAPDDPDLLHKMNDMLTMHGMNSRILYRGIKPYTVMVESINFRNLLNHFGFGREKSLDKFLYDPIIQLPDSIIRHVLSGLFDSDCSVQVNKNKIRFTSGSQRLVSDIQTMLLRFGIMSYIYSQNPKHHTLNISGKYVNLFIKYIGFSSKRNMNKLAQMKCSMKTDNDIIPNGKQLVSLFKKAYYSKYPTSRGVKGKGLNSPSMRKIGSKCSAVLNNTLKLSKNMFNELYDILQYEDIMLSEFQEIKNRNYYYVPVKSVDVVKCNSPLMEIEVDISHNYIANGIVTHNSQGSTIENVYVIERDLNILTWNNTIRNKLKYTAFTRASKLLRILQ